MSTFGFVNLTWNIPLIKKPIMNGKKLLQLMYRFKSNKN